MPTNVSLFVTPPNTVLLPGVMMALAVSGRENASLVAQLYKDEPVVRQKDVNALVGFVTAKDTVADKPVTAVLDHPSDQLSTDSADLIKIRHDPGGTSFYQYGCLAKIVRLDRTATGDFQLVAEGISRFQVDKIVQRSPYFIAQVLHVENTILDSADISTYTIVAQFKRLARELISLLNNAIVQQANNNLSTNATNMVNIRSMLRKLDSYVNQSTFQDTAKVADLVVFTLDVPASEKLPMLQTGNTVKRLEIAVQLIAKQLNMIKISQKINTSVDSSLSKKQREFLLRQQMQAIRRELGEKDENGGDDGDLSDLTKKLEAAKLTPEANAVAQKELKRLKKMQPTQAEYQVCRTYLETLAEIPWSKATDDMIDSNAIRAARHQLDSDHYGLGSVKKRLLEYLAVVRLKSRGQSKSVIEKAPILLLVGPPGVGKTSLARSIATALGRKFHRISLGGVRDEAEIRGHRRTYVGAMPGLIVQGLKKVGVVNPVFLLDEIDKLGENNFHGDPSAAMLEVLDPEQNNTFNDHYVNVPIDLSKTLFIATANSIDTISPPLLDRMEMISLSGYTYLEKQHIARQYLLPKQAVVNGLQADQVQMSDNVLQKIATSYTREAGVRNLEREIATVCRSKAVEFSESLEAEGKYTPDVTLDDVEKFLGIEKYESEITTHENRPGVVTGLAYMGSGNGGLLFIEASKYASSRGVGGSLQLTGNLGGVIKESAQIAMTWVRSNSLEMNLVSSATETPFANWDVHIHAPAGAVKKDGPSAGVAMTLALVSLLSMRAVPADVAVTGEMTLRGQILPVGGIKEKLLAAHRAGIKKVLLPTRNRKDVEQDMPENVRKEMTFVYLKNMWDALVEIWPQDIIRPIEFFESRL
ncbi:Lon protease C-terminal proteolytic domain-containing protein [Lipomyces japonicus]|uniref:Lon protease C-terminal proteolytic domain-containing protein n=1 Tax=Lipomyces japonicus TaxID=56871 RepID=UPI0034CD6283